MSKMEFKIESDADHHKLYMRRRGIRWTFIQSFMSKVQLIECMRMMINDTWIDAAPHNQKKI